MTIPAGNSQWILLWVAGLRSGGYEVVVRCGRGGLFMSGCCDWRRVWMGTGDTCALVARGTRALGFSPRRTVLVCWRGRSKRSAACPSVRVDVSTDFPIVFAYCEPALVSRSPVLVLGRLGCDCSS